LRREHVLTSVASEPRGQPPRCAHLDRDWARPFQIFTGDGLSPATSAPRLGSPLPHLHRDWAHRCHICTGTGPTAATSAPGLGSPLAHLHWARPASVPDPPQPLCAMGAVCIAAHGIVGTLISQVHGGALTVLDRGALSSTAASAFRSIRSRKPNALTIVSFWFSGFFGEHPVTANKPI
jgi:hypothetical protein